jgi:hypothetical protein
VVAVVVVVVVLLLLLPQLPLPLQQKTGNTTLDMQHCSRGRQGSAR